MNVRAPPARSAARVGRGGAIGRCFGRRCIGRRRIGVENFNDLKVGDVIECYRTEEVARTLQSGSANS